MTGRYLLDTSSAIALFAGDPGALDHLADAEAVFVPSIVLGELYYGARKSNQPEANLARIDDFAANAVILACDGDTARRYGQVKDRLRRQGQPLPENDIWIAAIAIQHGLALATRDNHFGEVEGLSVAAW